jgi:hypothetical protein
MEEFCPRCGRYLKDGEYQCPECGNVVRQIPVEEVPPEIRQVMSGQGLGNVLLKSVFTDKWFYIPLVASFAAMFAVTYYWRFSFLFFLVPLLLPVRRLSLALGLMIGVAAGSLGALAAKYIVLGSWIA